jgi:redox-sensitive bicupin YhaK (pirin superfamily)
MIRIRKSADRGRTRLPWLDSRHSFSFGRYRDREWMGHRSLRVLNEDRVAPGTGFGPHPHRDAEIVTLVLDGALEHRDSEGSRSVLRRGDVQRMSAGRGVVHAEWNASATEPVHFAQIWLLPRIAGAAPRYDELRSGWHREEQFALLASGDGRDGSLAIHCDAQLSAGTLPAGARVRLPLRPGRGAWLQVLRGRMRVGEDALEAGDGAALEGERAIELGAVDAADLLLFELD